MAIEHDSLPSCVKCEREKDREIEKSRLVIVGNEALLPNFRISVILISTMRTSLLKLIFVVGVVVL